MTGSVWDEWQTWAAIYAAVVATAALALEVRRWVESGVRLSLSLMTNAQTIQNGKVGDARHLLVVVSNRGDRATTVTHLAALDYSGHWYSYWWRRLRHRPTQTLLVPDPRPDDYSPPVLPSVLEPGKQWHGFTDWETIKPLVIKAKGMLFIAVVSSDATHPRLKRIPLKSATAPEPRTVKEQARGDYV